MGQGMFFRPGTFDGCISVSALQWLCQAETRKQVPIKRLTHFFESLYSCLTKGARAVFQFYPESDIQLRMINEASQKSGFHGGFVIDFPNSRAAKKYYLTIFAGDGPRGRQNLPAAHTEENDFSTGVSKGVDQNMMRKRRKMARARAKLGIKGKGWVMQKKDVRRKQGKKVKNDSKYTARKRKPRF
jgi:18S rRNA (guanine1575-N7)-methyltransferase